MAEVVVNIIWRWSCPEDCGQMGLAYEEEVATRHLTNHLLRKHAGFILTGELVHKLHVWSPTWRRDALT